MTRKEKIEGMIADLKNGAKSVIVNICLTDKEVKYVYKQTLTSSITKD